MTKPRVPVVEAVSLSPLDKTREASRLLKEASDELGSQRTDSGVHGKWLSVDRAARAASEAVARFADEAEDESVPAFLERLDVA